MSYTLQHFETLRQRFPTWAELHHHLSSPEGGSLRVLHKEGDTYAILRYSKGKSSDDVSTGLFRSVVWNTLTNLPVCMAPAKARDGLPVGGSTPLSATEDFIDGVMVNAFLEKGSQGGLQIATRTVLGGITGFYSKKSFSELFYDALAATPLKDADGLTAVLSGLFDQVSGSNAAFASFVLQHTEHRVVAKVVTPALYCVHMGTVNETGVVHMSEKAVNWPQQMARLQIPSYPIRQIRTEQEIQDLLRKMAIQRGWRWQGLVFKDGFGGRWRVRTPTYLMLRELRGSEATLEERFLRLRSTKKVKDYLTHYSEDRAEMWELEKKMRACTDGILAAYNDVHKAHAVAFKDLPEAYKPAVYLLHLKWRDELRSRGFKIRQQNAIEIMNRLKPFEQMRLLKAGVYEAKSKGSALEVLATEAGMAEMAEQQQEETEHLQQKD